MDEKTRAREIAGAAFETAKTHPGYRPGQDRLVVIVVSPKDPANPDDRGSTGIHHEGWEGAPELAHHLSACADIMLLFGGPPQPGQPVPQLPQEATAEDLAEMTGGSSAR